MAERRMFAKTIIDSDAFIEMPMSARLLYYDLSMRADDDGFNNSPTKVMRMIGASKDDLNILIARKFIIPFQNGVVVIKHWRIHNYIRKDTYNETPYKEQKAMLELDENNAYRMIADGGTPYLDAPSTSRQQAVDEPWTQDRLGKDSIGKDRLVEKGSPQKRFVPPSLEEVQAYCSERGNGIDAQAFIDFYASKGWMVGKTKMSDWKAAVRTWESRNRKQGKPTYSTTDYGNPEDIF
jgi:hypothetical protein